MSPRPTPPARSARLPSRRARPSASVTAFAALAPAPGSSAPLSATAGLGVTGLRIAEPTGALVATRSEGKRRVYAFALLLSALAFRANRLSPDSRSGVTMDTAPSAATTRKQERHKWQISWAHPTVASSAYGSRLAPA
jgi:hypothetical protein